MGLGGERDRATVVIVDDSDEVRTLVRTQLELSGMFEVVAEGTDGAEAMGLAYRHQPALIVLDTSMPTMDGLEALPAILTLAPETRVVMFTGFGERNLADRARELGAADFIEKSIPIQDLPDRLWRSIGEEPTAATPVRGLRVVSEPLPPAIAEGQAMLDEHLERFREVFHQAAIGMATVTLNGSIVRANPALAAMMACEAEDLVGVDYGILTRGRGDLLDDGLAAINEMGETLVSFEHPLPTGDDPPTVRVTLTPIHDSKGRPLYVFAQVQDISGQRRAEDELRRSEERFRLLVTAVRDYAIFMLDPSGIVVSWNAGAQGIKGYRAEEIIGQSFEVFYPAEERASGHPAHNLAAAIRDGAYAEEGWRIRKDGSRFWASVVLTAVYDDRGRHIGFAKVTRDQTQARQHEEERREALDQQAHLLAVTAHELRTPTAVVDGSATLLASHWEELGEKGRAQLLASISASGQRLQRLAGDLSTASRLHRDALELKIEDVTMADAVREAVGRARAAHGGVSITVDCDDVIFRADPARIAQVLDNLLDNATRHGTGPVTICCRASEDTVSIIVADSGNGISADLLPRLFDRFAIAGPTGGTGLGLYLVREIARRHGGEASYRPRSEQEQAAFVVDLPRHQPEGSG